MLKNLAINWASSSQRREFEKWLNYLRGCSSEDMGAIVALTSYWKYELRNQGIEAMAIDVELARNPLIIIELGNLIRQLQKSGKQIIVPGLMNWMHSFRAIAHPELRIFGRQMWGELSRGFPFAQAAATNLFDAISLEISMDGFDEIPIGLEPNDF